MNILIVDDNPVNLKLFETLARRLEDCAVHAFADPLAALSWCAANRPDLILLDYMMPGLDGIGFLERLRQDPGMAEAMVIMITADTEKEVRLRALDAGANDFLTKPVDTAEFLARMKNAMALQRARRQLADRAALLAEEVAKAVTTIKAREREAIFLLARAAEYRDPETGAHILRMAHFSRLIALQLGLSAEETNLLLEAAPMHDIGKVGIPDAILLKPGRLDEAEFALMQRHAEIGAQIFASHASDNPLLEMATTIALTHHEKFDGTGYPRKLAGAAIPLVGRIVAVADVFDALTSVRPYKRAWSLDEARVFLEQQSGAHFDPQCVAAFLARWDEVLAIHAQYRDETAESPIPA